ncbi:MAG: hypothetical protein HW380_333 [Magnetococcales bacterium]|nr:hypothetical protein [Magnetococcales bacterium]
MAKNRATLFYSGMNQQGNIIIAVMISMLMITLLVSALIEHFLVAEARAVEESLAKVRVYWAMSGHVDYYLSRVKQYASQCSAGSTIPSLTNFNTAFNNFIFVAGQHNTCDTTCNATNTATDTQEIIQCILNDLETDKATDIRTWNNYDGNAGYTFAIKHMPEVAGKIQFKLVNPGTIAALSGLDARLLPLYVNAKLDEVTPTATLTVEKYERY